MPPVLVPEPSPSTTYTFPVFKLRIDDLEHKGVDIFFDAVNPKDVLRSAVETSLNWLYTPETAPTNVKEILLVLRPTVEGVAHTFGTETHKEIHLSLDYIVQTQGRAKDEITGVIVHEMVHCFQYDAKETCPGGLIEGIADYVRLKQGLGPPHWQQRIGKDWKAGYEATAYFLDWIEQTFGEGTIKALNGRMKDEKYDDKLFEELTAATVHELWAAYCGFLDVDVEHEPDVARPLPKWPMPKLLIRVDDLNHEGTDVFFGAVKPKDALEEAVIASFNWLYTLENVPVKVKEILLVLRPMDGVAYTTGSATHKEIHYSLDYIKKTEARARDEIMGVLVHEVVHCFQYDGHGSCPGGLIEGIADFVRLRKGLGPPHWKKRGGEEWDMGYEGTAYFLDWIEKSCGKDTIIQELNIRMNHDVYDASLFKDLTRKSVDDLWKEYCNGLEQPTDESLMTAGPIEGTESASASESPGNEIWPPEIGKAAHS